MAKLTREQLEEKYDALYAYEREYHAKGYSVIAGIDEAGRGPLAGPVVAACVVLSPGFPVEILGDSKKLSDYTHITLHCFLFFTILSQIP